MGTALSIFLGFRNSSSYERYWEARKLWGGIVNSSRVLARQVLTLSNHDNSFSNRLTELSESRKRMIYRHLAWVNSLRLQLRGQTDEKSW